MVRHSTLLVAAFAILTASAFAQQTPAAPPQDPPLPTMPPLLPGMDAPKLKVDDWLAGKPIDEFKKNRIYVLEFFATEIPKKDFVLKFEELNQKYKKKATFAAISVWEKDQMAVTPFVKGFADKISYSVAIDQQATPIDKHGFMSENWLRKAGWEITPVVFIVGKDQRIAWTGLPSQADVVLQKVVDDKWDPKTEVSEMQTRVDKARADIEAWLKHPVKLQIDKIVALMRDQKFEDALKEMDVLIGLDGKDSKLNPQSYGIDMKINLYIAMQDLDGFYATAEKAVELITTDSVELNNIAWKIVDPESQMPEKHWDIALKLATKAVDLDHRKQGAFLDTLAWAYFGNGDKEKAIATEKEAANVSEGDEKTQYENNIKKFQAKTDNPPPTPW